MAHKKEVILLVGLLLLLLAFPFVLGQGGTLQIKILNNKTVVNSSFVAYGINGYDYHSNNSNYFDFMIKAHSSYGDGTQHCYNDSGKQYCFIYQSSDMSYRDQVGSQDYITSIVDSTVVFNGNTAKYANVFTNTNLTFTINGTTIKENYIVGGIPRAPASYLGANVSLDFGGYIKFSNMSLYSNGINYGNSSFVTSSEIDFVSPSGKIIFYLPTPYAYDSSGNRTSIQYEVKNQGSQIWFYTRTPFSWLNSTSRSFPVYIDPTIISQATSQVEYDDADNSNLITTFTLQKYNGTAYNIEPNNIWIKNQTDCQALGKNGVCFGATDNSLNETQRANYSYVINSTYPIYITNDTSTAYPSPIFSTNYISPINLALETQYYYFSDICNYSYANCQWNINNGIATITFVSNKYIDPTVSIAVNSIFGTGSLYNNVTAEGSAFSHLTVDTTQVPTNSLVAYFPFDVQQNTSLNLTYDYSPYANDGTLKAGVVFTNNCLFGSCYNFTSASSQSINATITQLKTSITMWVKNSTDTGWTFLAKNETAFFNNNGVAGLAGRPFPFNNVSNNVRIGVNYTVNYTGTNLFYSGLIDNVMVFNVSLSVAQIQAIYNNQTAIFKSQGQQTVQEENITSGYNLVNVTTSSNAYQGTNITLRIGAWDITQGYNNNDTNSSFNNLVSYYHLDEASYNGTTREVIDATGRNNGTAQNASVRANTTAYGYYYRGANFDGKNTYINITITQGITSIALWQFNGTAPASSSSNGWIFVAYNGTTFFTNAVSGLSAQFPINVTGTNVKIGINYTGSTNSFFNGTIDEVMIWNRSITLAEVQQLYIKGTNLWNYTSYQNLTGNNQFNISTLTTNLLPDFLLSVNSTNPFYSPNLGNGIGINLTTTYTLNPVVNITYPLNTTYNINVSNLNYTLTDPNNTVTCWYSTNGGTTNSTSTSVPNGANSFTNVISSQGSNTWIVYCNDTNGKRNSSSVTFFMDTLHPNANLTSPLNGTYTNNSLVNFTYNVTDNSTGTGLANSTLYVYNQNANWCYQESATVSNQGFPFGNPDGNSSYCSLAFTGSYTQAAGGHYYVTYTKPAGAVYGSVWEVSHGNIGAYNITIPQDCWNASTTNVQLRIDSNFNPSSTQPYCYNGTGWETIGQFSTSGAQNLNSYTCGASTLMYDGNWSTFEFYSSCGWDYLAAGVVPDNYWKIYEEAMFWDINPVLYNQTTQVYGSNVFSALIGVPLTLVDGIYNWFVQVFDLARNSFVTQNSTVTVDTVFPKLNITFPLNNTLYGINVSVINYTASDANPNQCWYSTNGGITNSTKQAFGTNFTGVISVDINNNWTVYCNDLVNHTTSATVTFNRDTTPPTIIVIEPGTTVISEAAGENIVMGLNVTDINNISYVSAVVTKPDSTKVNVSMMGGQILSDNFLNGNQWFNENNTLNQSSQTCTGIFTGGKAITYLSGNGDPQTDTYCTEIGNNPLFGDFNITIKYNITTLDSDSAANFQIVSEQPTSSNAVVYGYIGRTNFAGEGAGYQVYAQDDVGNSLYNKITTSDTYGAFKIQRQGSLFTFYYQNNTDLTWISLVSGTLDMHTGIWPLFESESAANNWGTANVTWTNFTATPLPSNQYIGTYVNTTLQGTYLVNFFANDTLNNINNYTTSSFKINQTNYPPSPPFILYPTPGSVNNKNITIKWSNVNDINNDTIVFNITLLNVDGSFNKTIIDNYGNINTNGYVWDTTTVPDSQYGLTIQARETSTPEHYTSQDTLNGNFTVSNTPPSFNTPPANTTVNYLQSVFAQFNVTSTKAAISAVTVNDSRFKITSPNPSNLTNATTLGVGVYNILVSANDTANNINNLPYTVTVNKISPSLSLSILPSTTVAYATIVNVTGSGCPSQLTCNLYSNDVLVANPYIWNSTYGVYNFVYNTTGNQNYTSFTTSNTLTVTDSVAPTVNQTKPLNDTYSNNTNQNFTVNMSDAVGGSGLKNVTYNIYNQTSLFNQTTVSLGGVFTSVVGLPVTLVDGLYYWFATVFDIAGNSVTSQNQTVTINTQVPQYSNVSFISTQYFNDSISYYANWNDSINGRLKSYTFSINYSNASGWINHSYSFTGNFNTSTYNEQILSPAGTFIQWYFTAFDQNNLTNSTSIQNYTVQNRTTYLTFTTDKTIYTQGYGSLAATQFYINATAGYVDLETSNPIPGATCYLFNSINSEQYLMTYNATTGYYFTNGLSTRDLYGQVNLTVNCQKTNYVQQNASKTIYSFFQVFLQDSALVQFDNAINLSTYMKRNPPTGVNTANMSFNGNYSEGLNFLTNMPYCGSGINCAFLRTYILSGTFTIANNFSISNNICQPIQCFYIMDNTFTKIYEDCGNNSQNYGLVNNTATYIQNSFSEDQTYNVGYFTGTSIYLNCSNNVTNVTSNIYYNATGTPPNFQITSMQPVNIQATVIGRGDLSANYTLQGNSATNVHKYAVLQFNNTNNFSVQYLYTFTPSIQIGYPNSVIPGTTNIYYSNGSLWASDNSSLGAPTTVLVDSANSITFTTPPIPANSILNVTSTSWLLNALIDQETWLVSNITESQWEINLSSIFTPALDTSNLLVVSNFSMYTDSWINYTITATVSNNSGTFDTNFTNTTHHIHFPLISTFNQYTAPTSYLVTAINHIVFPVLSVSINPNYVNSGNLITVTGSGCPTGPFAPVCNLYEDGVLVSNPYTFTSAYSNHVFVYNTTGNPNFAPATATNTFYIYTSMNYIFTPTLETYTQNLPANVQTYCYDANNQFCDADVSCNLTAYYPNSSILFLQQPMIFTPGYFYYSLTGAQTALTGNYNTYASCINSNQSARTSTATYVISSTGKNVNDAVDIVPYNVWNYGNNPANGSRNLTYTAPAIATVNTTDIAVAVWNFTPNRTLTYYPPQVDLTNYSQVALSVWSYTGTINGNILAQFAAAIWNYAGSISVINSQIAQGVWNFSYRYIHGEVLD